MEDILVSPGTWRPQTITATCHSVDMALQWYPIVSFGINLTRLEPKPSSPWSCSATMCRTRSSWVYPRVTTGMCLVEVFCILVYVCTLDVRLFAQVGCWVYMWILQKNFLERNYRDFEARSFLFGTRESEKIKILF